MQEEMGILQKIIKIRVGIKEKAVFYARSAKINRGESREDRTYEEKNVHLNIVLSQQQTRFLIKELYRNSAGTLREWQEKYWEKQIAIHARNHIFMAKVSE